jgi:hypothetical protein
MKLLTTECKRKNLTENSLLEYLLFSVHIILFFRKHSTKENNMNRKR